MITAITPTAQPGKPAPPASKPMFAPQYTTKLFDQVDRLWVVPKGGFADGVAAGVRAGLITPVLLAAAVPTMYIDGLANVAQLGARLVERIANG